MMPFSVQYQHKVSLSNMTLFIFIAIFLSSCSQLKPIKITQDFAVSKLKTVHTLDIYTENSNIHTLLSGIDSDSQQLVLRYTHSLDTGETWSTPVTVNQQISPVKKSKRGNDFQIAASGQTVMTIWSTQGSQPWVGIISVALSLDQGKTWKKIPSPVSSDYSAINQGYYDLTADQQGNFYITWLDDREELGNTQALRYARFQTKNSTWSNHSILESTACTCCWSTITTDKQGAIHVLYRDDSPRDMMLISSFDDGKSWKKPQSIGNFNWTFMGCPHQGGGIATTDVNGKTSVHTIIWNGNEDKRGVYYRRLNPVGANDTPIIPVSDDTSVSGDIATINQRVGLIYVKGTAENKQVMVRLSDNNGESWQKEKALTALGSEPSHPRIVGTTEGFRFFWTEWQEDGRAIAVMSHF